MPCQSPSRRKDSNTLRVLLAILVLVGQMLAPGLRVSMDAAIAGDTPAWLLAQSAICHSDDGTGDGTGSGATVPEKSPHKPGSAHDCVLCPVCHSVGLAILVPQGAGGPMAPAPTRSAQPGLPPPITGPPGQVRATARPRAPPFVFI